MYSKLVLTLENSEYTNCLDGKNRMANVYVQAIEVDIYNTRFKQHFVMHSGATIGKHVYCVANSSQLR